MVDLLKIKKFKEVDRKVNHIGECFLFKKTNEDLDFCTEYLSYDRDNILGIEYCWEAWIRISVIKVQCEDAFFKLMEALKLLAHSRGYKIIRLAEHIEPEILNVMTRYGFIQENISDDNYNSYLFFQISEIDEIEEEGGEETEG